MATLSTQPSHDPTGRSRTRPLAAASALSAPILLTILVFVLFGRIGFSPTDEGTILAQSYRILHGQVPHQDFVFARPTGSGLLHIIDFGIPMALFEASRLIGIFEIVLYSSFFAWFIYRIPPWRWGVIHALGALGAAMINFHVFFLGSWYTEDGLLFAAIGLVALESGLRRNSRRSVYGGMFALGLAPFMKQSFAFVPLIGAAWIWLHMRGRGDPDRRKVAFVGLAVAALPLAAYCAALGVLGGLDDFMLQISKARPVWGREFVTHLADARDGALSLALIVVFAILAVALRRRRRSSLAPAAGNDRTGLIVRVLLSGILIVVPVASRLEFGGIWAIVLTWCLVVWLLLDLPRGIDGNGLIIAAIAWMTALSWGIASPNLVGGTIVLYVLHRAWRDSPPIAGPAARRVLTALVAFAVIVVGARFYRTRTNEPYLERPASALTSDLHAISPSFGHIRTNPVTARYLKDITTCLRLHPASRVAILPDNPGLYPALDLRNPFPIDWMLQDEIANEEKAILATARALDRRGDYLVLFQTRSAFVLWVTPELEPASPASRPIFSLGGQILETLRGERITCGSFIGRYARGA